MDSPRRYECHHQKWPSVVHRSNDVAVTLAEWFFFPYIQDILPDSLRAVVLVDVHDRLHRFEPHHETAEENAMRGRGNGELVLVHGDYLGFS